MDAASDIDLVMAVETKTCGIQIRTWICRDIEILYVSLESLAAPRPTRSTLLGATLLYDAQDRLAPLVRQWEAHSAERQTPPAEREYGRWEIAHALMVMEHIAACAPRATLLCVRNEWVPDVARYLFDLQCDWPLAAADPSGNLVSGHRHRLRRIASAPPAERWIPNAGVQPLEEAVIYAWPVQS